MAQRLLHVEVTIRQRAKQGRQACGDVASVLRSETETTIVVCDGIGSGAAAHVAAAMCRARCEQMLARGFSLRETFLRIAASMEQYKQPGKPYAAFTVAQIRTNGQAQVFAYEAPPPIWVTPRQAQPLAMRHFMHGTIAGSESACYLRNGEGLLLLSDGITQAGMDTHPGGWQAQGVADAINRLLGQHPMSDLPLLIQEKALALNKGIDHDDATVAWIACRPACPLNILTGPPADKTKDRPVVERFMARPGPKVVCGATTAEIVARVLSRAIEIEKEPASLIAPPKYLLQGIDLVTEGAVTLNQLNNILELDPETFYEINAVTELYDLMTAADRLYIILGSGKNPANEDTCFVQRGVLTREKIVPLIADKLRRQGKCVLIESV